MDSSKVFRGLVALIGTLLFSFVLSLMWSSGAQAQGVAELKGRKDQLKKEIDSLNQDLSCKTDKDCRAIELGAKPCGGPWSYLVSSTLNKNYSKLEKQIATYNETEKKLNELDPKMSTCDFLTPPEVFCQTNKKGNKKNICAAKKA